MKGTVCLETVDALSFRNVSIVLALLGFSSLSSRSTEDWNWCVLTRIAPAFLVCDAALKIQYKRNSA
jgi:hypothetical protein